MKNRTAIAVLLSFLAMNAYAEGTLLKAVYSPVAGSDVEYGQGAIERQELAHREIARNVWLIRVEEGTADEWQRRLSESAGKEHGSFKVTEPTDEERRRVESGEITLQK